jgi:preprotein translocase subunit SecE
MSLMATVNKPPSEKKDKKPRQADTSVSAQSIAEYFKGIRAEWKKITWPTWPQIWGQTIVVLVMVSIMTLGLFIMDYSFHWIITLITPHRS